MANLNPHSETPRSASDNYDWLELLSSYTGKGIYIVG